MTNYTDLIERVFSELDKNPEDYYLHQNDLADKAYMTKFFFFCT